MTDDLGAFFALRRRIFGQCPDCGELFRLGDAEIFTRDRPEPDWKDQRDQAGERLEAAEDKLENEKCPLREAANAQGRRAAQAQARKLDWVFRPLKLNADDAKVVFHPVDYVVFNGLNQQDKGLKSIVLVDRATQDRDRRPLQRSIECAVEAGKVDWHTLRVRDDGQIEME